MLEDVSKLQFHVLREGEAPAKPLKPVASLVPARHEPHPPRFRHIFVSERNSSSLSPVGRSGNSPAIYRWGDKVSFESLVPKGRQE